MSHRTKPVPSASQSSPKGRLSRVALVCALLVVGYLIFRIVTDSRGPGTTSLQPPAVATSTDKPGMVLIPGGEFTMGTDDTNSMRNEHPAHRVRVSPYWIDRHAVTNAEFKRFVDATGYVTTAERAVDWDEMKKQLPAGTPKPADELLRPGAVAFTPPGRSVGLENLQNWWTWTVGANWRHPEGPASNIDGREAHPVVQVSWDDANAYAKWAGKRLPTEAEWEFAARGGLDGKRYNWGDDPSPGGRAMANTYTGTFPVKDTAADGFAGTSPVASFPANGYGLYDMAGNVWNWCADYYADDAHVELASQGGVCFDPSGPSRTRSLHNPAAVERVTKGGSFLCNPNYCESYRPSARRGVPPDTGMGHIGFRCAASGR